MKNDIKYKFCPVCGTDLKICTETSINYTSSSVINYDCECGLHIKQTNSAGYSLSVIWTNKC